MPAMVAVIKTWAGFGGPRLHFVSLPLITSLIDSVRYYPYPPDEPPPAPAPKAPRRPAPQPRRGGKKIIALDE